MEQYDFVIVGAGSAGCVLAHDLGEGGRNRVLVLENGPTDRHPFVKVPLGYGLLFYDPARNYRLATCPEPGLGGRQLYYPRGKAVGGSGSINAMVYCRGLPSDFDDWESQGLPGWGWDGVRPVFDALEEATTGMSVTNPTRLRHPFTRHFASAARELGLPDDADFNGTTPEGAGFYRITTRNGRRRSSADTFLRPALARGNVRLLTHAQVASITVKEGRATGVSYVRHGKRFHATASRAVVMAAGAIHTPQILQLSGIGDPTLLQQFDIPVQLANDNVGAHLQDHLAVGYYYRASEKTLNSQLYSRMAQAAQAVRYLAARQGPLANSVNQYGGFLRSTPSCATPDQQLYFNPATYTESRGRNGPVIQPDPFPGYTLSFQPTRPASRGHVRITAPNIDTAPEISLGALSCDTDLAAVRAGGRLIAQFVRTDALRKVTESATACCPSAMTDDEIIADFRARAGSVFHPCGSCAMGPDPAKSVVGSDMSVHGMRGLFVADASVFPSIPSGNINAPTLMVARKGAAHILTATKGNRP
ncbi:choline dehydrogenase [Pseudohalocynthiibacter aestuariivivens]|nr:GMC family oxidoreductase N-terminal domain-containing protein [Pseudohalocynthiibacter aestuariivivens]QIE46291.1 choline dehydrogenase [Pseudohalocynthiibacter aestuariivivens]